MFFLLGKIIMKTFPLEIGLFQNWFIALRSPKDFITAQLMIPVKTKIRAVKQLVEHYKEGVCNFFPRWLKFRLCFFMVLNCYFKYLCRLWACIDIIRIMLPISPGCRTGNGPKGPHFPPLHLKARPPVPVISDGHSSILFFMASNDRASPPAPSNLF